MRDRAWTEDSLPLSWILRYYYSNRCCTINKVVTGPRRYVGGWGVEAGKCPPPSPSNCWRAAIMIVDVRWACLCRCGLGLRFVSWPLTLGLPCRASPIPGVSYTLHHTPNTKRSLLQTRVELETYTRLTGHTYITTTMLRPKCIVLKPHIFASLVLRVLYTWYTG